MNNHYNPRLTKYAHELRHESVSIAEKHLWKNALSRSKCGAKFKRQRPIDSFIVDFFSPEIGLIIEVDGSSHFSKSKYDKYRQNKLESFGYTLLRGRGDAKLWRCTNSDTTCRILFEGEEGIYLIVFSIRGVLLRFSGFGIESSPCTPSKGGILNPTS